MNAGELYPPSVFKNWGQSPSTLEAETLAEVWFFLLTPIGSIPFMREYGSDLLALIGQPDQLSIIDLSKVGATNSLAQAYFLEDPTRQALTDTSWINLLEDVDGDADIEVRYMRMANRKVSKVTQ